MAIQPPVGAQPLLINEWLTGRITPAFGRIELATSDGVTNELIRSIKSYSEIGKLGRQLLSTNGHPNPRASFHHLQAFIRQGTTLFRGCAEPAPPCKPTFILLLVPESGEGDLLLSASKLPDRSDSSRVSRRSWAEDASAVLGQTPARRSVQRLLRSHYGCAVWGPREHPNL